MLRTYFIHRFLVNCMLILPLIVIYQVWSATYTYNLIIVLIVLLLSELAITLGHSKYLYKKSVVELVEEIQPSQQPDFISHFNSKTRSIVAYLNSWKATKYLIMKLRFQYLPDLVPRYHYFRP
jgi:hypothetical protein